METIRVLYVEDDAGDRELTRRHLARHAPHLKLQTAGTVGEALDQLAAGNVDVVLSDYRLPDATGLDLLEAIKTRELMVPVILVTGSGDAEAAVRLLKAGAADYVVKRAGHLETLPPVVEGAFRWFQSVQELRRTTVRILYAEHDPADVELVQRAFREHAPHFRLEVAWRTRDILERLQTVPYDLLLLDYRMPDHSGIEILKTLREERIRIPVVMVTGQGDEETAVQAFKLGAADYIIKREGDLPKLPATLENVLAQRRLADEKDALLVLNGLTRSIATLREVGEVVQRATKAARDLLKAEMSLLWLVEGAALHPVAWSNIEDAVARSLRVEVDEPLVEQMRSERRVVLSALLTRGGAPHPPLLAEADHTLAVSLVAAAGLVGVLVVASQRPGVFGATEERLLTILADHVAIAVENARLYQQLKDQLETLQRTQAQLLQTEKVAAMGQLLAGVAHELNNPLAVVMGRTALLAEQLAGSPLAAQAEKIAQAAERSARIVRNFLALARERPPERRRVDLNLVVREAVELLAYQLVIDDVEVVLDLARDLPPLWADPNQLHQVAVNLLSNAHHALRGSRLPRRVTMTTRVDAARSRVSLTVADSGPGIPAEVQGRLFEPFFTTKPTGQGTGLGLSLCQGIVEGHAGSIRVESPPGQGAVFRVELPAGALPDPEVEEPAGTFARRVPGRAILIADDEPEVAGMLAEMLTADGHRVHTVSNGVAALARLQDHAYDLIVTDVKMPELGGPGLYRELERRYPALLRRVIVLTGDTLSQEVTEFLAGTGVCSLSKPFTLDEVRRAIQRVLPAS